jgi:hypothetical protein
MNKSNIQFTMTITALEFEGKLYHGLNLIKGFLLLEAKTPVPELKRSVKLARKHNIHNSRAVKELARRGIYRKRDYK